jgi:hypothetical protein
VVEVFDDRVGGRLALGGGDQVDDAGVLVGSAG